MPAVQCHQGGVGCADGGGDQCIRQTRSMGRSIVTPPQAGLDGDQGIDQQGLEGGDEIIQARSLFAITYAPIELGHADGRQGQGLPAALQKLRCGFVAAKLIM